MTARRLRGSFRRARREQAAQDYRQSGRRPRGALSCIEAGLPRLSTQAAMQSEHALAQITCYVHEDARDHARSFVGTLEFEQLRDQSALAPWIVQLGVPKRESANHDPRRLHVAFEAVMGFEVRKLHSTFLRAAMHTPRSRRVDAVDKVSAEGCSSCLSAPLILVFRSPANSGSRPLADVCGLAGAEDALGIDRDQRVPTRARREKIFITWLLRTRILSQLNWRIMLNETFIRRRDLMK